MWLGQGLDDPRFDFRQRQEAFLLSKLPRLTLGLTQPPTEWLSVSLLGGKAAGLWNWLLTAFRAEVKSEWSSTSNLPMWIHGMQRHSDIYIPYVDREHLYGSPRLMTIGAEGGGRFAYRAPLSSAWSCSCTSVCSIHGMAVNSNQDTLTIKLQRICTAYKPLHLLTN
jgi:hypothetical protein